MNEQSKNLFILTRHPCSPQIDGSSVVFRNIFDRLTRAVDLVFLAPCESYSPFEHVTVLDLDGVEYPSGSRYSSLDRILQLFKLYRFFRRHVEMAQRYDSMNTNSIYVALILCILKKQRVIRSYNLVLHDCLTKYNRSVLRIEKNPAKKAAAGCKLWIMSLLEKAVYRRANVSVMVSDDDAREIKKLTGVHPEVIELGVDERKIFRSSGIQREKDSLLFLGNLAYFPNRLTADRLVWKIFPEVQKRRPSVRLYLVGGGFSGTIDNPSISYCGFVDDVNVMYNTSSLFVCPMDAGSGMKTKILESMAASLPLICTSESLKGIHHDGALDECIAETDTDFVEKIIDALDNYSKYENIAERALSLVREKYLWSTQARKYINVLALE